MNTTQVMEMKVMKVMKAMKMKAMNDMKMKTMKAMKMKAMKDMKMKAMKMKAMKAMEMKAMTAMNMKAMRAMEMKAMKAMKAMKMKEETMEAMYGYFRCTKCHSYWESAHTYRKPGGQTRLTRKGKRIPAFYKQKCKGCVTFSFPFGWKRKLCQYCKEYCCICKNRRNDRNKPHLRHLCEKCLSGDPC